MSRIGVLALQGDFAAHAAAIGSLGTGVEEVRRAGQLAGLRGLVLPGGESTTMLRLMEDEAWFAALGEFRGRGGSFLATCAGTILLAREVRKPRQRCLGFLDVVVERNAYGRQLDSFETRIRIAGEREPVVAVFIRAPRIVASGESVEILARNGEDPVLVRQGRILAATFHPELGGSSAVHRRFLEMTAQSSN